MISCLFVYCFFNLCLTDVGVYDVMTLNANPDAQPEIRVMANRTHKPTEETRAQVRALAAFGTDQEHIAKFVGCSHPTLRKHYPDELKFSAINANAQVGQFLYHMASGNALRDGATHGECSRAAMFWAKTRMGWRETDRLEHTGADGQPITFQRIERVVIDAKTEDED